MLRASRLEFLPLLAVPGNQFLQLVTVGTVAPESVLIEKALCAAAEANLVTVTRSPHRPAHPPMPAAAEQNRSTG